MSVPENHTAKQYRILKIPVNREKSVFYYYKPFELVDIDKEKTRSTLIDIPANKSIYITHFLRPIEENFLLKFFGQVGKIKQIHFG